MTVVDSSQAGTRNSAIRIHDALREQILSGMRAPGEVLSQVALAEEYRTSRGPIREALRLLQREGLIEAETNKRVRVRGIALDDLEQLYALRILTESFAVRVSVPLYTDEHLRELERLLIQLERPPTEDMATWEASHRRYHEALGALAGERTAELIRNNLDHAARYRHLNLTRAPQAADIGASEHRAVFEACTAGDGEEAGRLIARHLARTALTVFAMVAAEREPTLVRTALLAVDRVGSHEQVIAPGTSRR